MLRIGIDLGGTNIAAGLVDDSGRIVRRANKPTNAPRPAEELIADMAALARELMAAQGVREVAGVGVGVPCTANQETGCMEDANNLGFDRAALIVPLTAALGSPVRFENDANCAAWAEYRLGGHTGESMLMVTLGTGIGGGIILNGKIWAGANYAAGEFGHMTLHIDGKRCTCGRRGCFECYGSATALLAQTRALLHYHRDSVLWDIEGRAIEAKDVFDGAARGDRLCVRVVNRYTDYLAEGISGLINIFQPDYVCIGGGVSGAGEKLLAPLREKTAKLVYSRSAARNAALYCAALGNDAGILGAALLF